MAGIAGRLLSATASAVAKRLWSLKSAAAKTGNRRRASSFPSPILVLFIRPFFLTGCACFRSLAVSASATAAVAGRSMVRYEAGYAVDTVFDGSKLGIEPHAVEITPAGDLLVLDSINSNIYRVQLPLSPCEHALPPTTPCPFQVWQLIYSSWDSAKCSASLVDVSSEWGFLGGWLWLMAAACMLTSSSPVPRLRNACYFLHCYSMENIFF